MTRFALVEGDDAIRALGPAWDALYERSGRHAPSMTSAALRAFLAHRIPPGHCGVILLAYNDEQLAGGVALLLREAWAHPRLYQARSIGDLEAHPTDVLLDAAAPPTLFAAMMSFLFATERRLFSVELSRVPEGSPVLTNLGGRLDYRSCIRTVGYGSYLEVPVGIDGLPPRLSSNFRKNLRKQSARLRELSGVSWQFLRGDECRPDHFEALFALEASGWKGRDGTAIASSARNTRYYRALLSELAASGELELHFLYTHHTLLAAHLAVRVGGTLTLLKIAYNEAFAAVAPGNMLLLELLRRESGSGAVRVIDCVTDMPWHLNWRMSRRRYCEVKMYPRRLLSTGLGYLPSILRSVLGRSRGLRGFLTILRSISRRSGQRTGDIPSVHASLSD